MVGPRHAAALAFVADIDVPVLDAVDIHHLERVLRLRPGQAVTAADGAGRWRPCRWRAGGALEATGEVEVEPAPAPALTVAFGLTKGARSEWVVQKLTEVGVDRIVPFVAARSVVRWDDTASARHGDRWRRVAREAAMQSRRARLPVVDEVIGFEGAVSTLGAGSGGAAMAEPGGAPPMLARPSVLIGPEGGWSVEELSCGLPLVGMGPGVLRAETAAVAAGVLLCALRAGVVGETVPGSIPEAAAGTSLWSPGPVG